MKAHEINHILRGAIPVLDKAFDGKAWELRVAIPMPQERWPDTYILHIEHDWSQDKDRFQMSFYSEGCCGVPICVLPDKEWEETLELVEEYDGEQAVKAWMGTHIPFELTWRSSIFKALIARWETLKHLVEMGIAAP